MRIRMPRFKIPVKKLMKWGSRANKFLRDTKLLSTLGSLYGQSGMKGSQAVGMAAPFAGAVGYGRRRKGGATRAGLVKGRGLYAAGGALRAAGGMKKRRSRRRR